MAARRAQYDRVVALRVDVRVERGEDRPPSGAPVRVELRDTLLADAPSPTVSAIDGAVGGEAGDVLATVSLPESEVDGDVTVWVHVDVSGTGRVSKGDYVTTQSYPAPSPEQAGASLAVTVRRVS